MYNNFDFNAINKIVSEQLDNITNFGHSVTMHVTEIGYEKSVLMIFKGYVNGKMSTLIQHISQLNFLLTSVPKENDRPKRPIGFFPPTVE